MEPMRTASLVAVVSLAIAAAILMVYANPAAQDPQAVEAELGLDRPARRLIQQGLTADGFDPASPDGLFGPRTRTAIRVWQAARAATETGISRRSPGGGVTRIAAAPTTVTAADTTDTSPPSPVPAVPEVSPSRGQRRSGCDNWNTAAFFETAIVEQVAACLAAGADVQARGEHDRTPAAL